MSLQLAHDFSFRAPSPKKLPVTSQKSPKDDYQSNLKFIYENQPTSKLLSIFEAKKQTYNQQKKELSYFDLQEIKLTRWKNLEELRVLRYVIEKREGIQLEIFE